MLFRPIVVLVANLFFLVDAEAFGPAGHLIAGEIAQARLCDMARREVDSLGEGESVAELGLWADRIRSLERWQVSAPWHYMNIADDTSLDDYSAPPEGDILWAIDRFSAQLTDDSIDSEDRADALRFLIHFVVDLHQPLHVGRASDRGGNSIDVLVSGESINLHSYWDSRVLRDELPVSSYLQRASGLLRLLEQSHTATMPRKWASESLAMRELVYDFDPDNASIDGLYAAVAAEITRVRLIQAGLRLADTINGLFCPMR